MKKRSEILDSLKNAAGKLQLVQKEILSMAVPGLHLTREDLGIRRNRGKKKQDTFHGQTHYQPRNNNKITTPGDGQGQFPQGITP